MGAFLRKPNTHKVTDVGGDLNIYGTLFGATAMQGWRTGMEDAHMAHADFSEFISIYGVFDGHGGACVSQWVALHMRETLLEVMKEEGVQMQCLGDSDSDMHSVAEAVRKTFIKLDEIMQQPEALKQLGRLEQEASKRSKETDKDSDSNGDSEDDVPSNTLLEVLSQDQDNQRTNMEKILLKIYKDKTPEIGEDHWEDDEENGPKVEEVKDETDEKEKVCSNETSDEIKSPESPEEDVTSIAEKVQQKKKEDLARKSAENELTEEAVKIHLEQDEEVKEESPPPKKSMRLIDVLLQSQTHSEDGGVDKLWPFGAGATAVVSILIRGPQPKLLVANAGDSRCVLCRAGNAIQMSRDHKPDLPDEEARITKAGGTVMMGRVDGNLNLSRSLGDLHHKNNSSLPPEEQRVTANPEILLLELTEDDEFLIIACDGIWDVLTSQACVDFVRERILKIQQEQNMEVNKGVVTGALTAADLGKICEELCDNCLSEEANSDGLGCDNMTVMIVQLGAQLRCIPSQQGVHISEGKLWQGRGREFVPYSSTTLASNTSVWTNDGKPAAILQRNF